MKGGQMKGWRVEGGGGDDKCQLGQGLRTLQT